MIYKAVQNPMNVLTLTSNLRKMKHVINTFTFSKIRTIFLILLLSANLKLNLAANYEFLTSQ